MKRLLARLLMCCAAQSTLGCRCAEDDMPASPPHASPLTVNQTVSAKSTPRAQRFAPAEALLRLATPAYHTQLAVTPSAIYLYSALGLHVLTQTSAPTLTALPAFSVATLDHTRLIAYREGQLHEVLLEKPGTQHVLGSIQHEPQLLAQHLGRPVWSSVNAQGQSELYSLSQGREHRVHTARGSISSLVATADRAYFVEQAPKAPEGERSWTLMSVPLDGGAAVSGPKHSGRTPSMLHLSEQLFYYHGPERRVYRTSRDFVVEQIAARDMVCSPLATLVHADSTGQLYCAHLGGITQLDLTSNDQHTLPLHPSGPITALAVGEPGVVFVVDSGREQLELYLSARARAAAP